MEDLEYKSSAAKRGAASRRQQQQQQQVEATILPLHTQTKPIPQAPRSGQVLLPNMLQFKVRDKKDVSAKRRFQVNIPRQYMVMLLLIFFIAPLLLFFYKEIHIHDDHEHYKAERFINVDTQDVLSHMFDFQNHTMSADNNDVKGKSTTGDTTIAKLEPTSPDNVKHTGNITVAGDSVRFENADKKSNSLESSEEKIRMRRLAS
jgi:hypothetical protein